MTVMLLTSDYVWFLANFTIRYSQWNTEITKFQKLIWRGNIYYQAKPPKVKHLGFVFPLTFLQLCFILSGTCVLQWILDVKKNKW